MNWTFKDINSRYLCNQALSASPSEIEKAFDNCETSLGKDWLYEHFKTQVGALPVLHILCLGSALPVLDGAKNRDVLIEKLKLRDTSALSELYALKLLAKDGPIEVEVEPPLLVGSTTKKPDFRIRKNEDAWLYVEVTKPDDSEFLNSNLPMLIRFGSIGQALNRSFELDILFLSELTQELEKIAWSEIISFCEQSRSAVSKLKSGLAMVAITENVTIDMSAPHDFKTLESVPKIGTTIISSPNGHRQKVNIRMPVTDERASLFLDRKAKQLPAEGSGLLVIDMLHVPGGFKSWPTLIRRRFQPAINTRFSAVCLMQNDISLSENGPTSISKSELIVNPHARKSLPGWLRESLTAAR